MDSQPIPSAERAAVGGAQLSVAPPTARDPLWHSPVFVLAPARSNSSVVTAMLGQHPRLCVFPELALFRKDTVGELLSDPPNWTGPPARLRLAGTLRALAEHHDGRQSPESVAAAASWIEARPSWTAADLLDHLLDLAAPRIGLEKSPENSSRDEYLERLDASYPRARYLHLTRHPVTTAASMHAAWSGRGYWQVEADLFHHFCLGVWYHQHARIAGFMARLPPDRGLRVRSEDVVNDPEQTLPGICEWLGIAADGETIEAMTHPERSPYAGLGPEGATGGWDEGFLRDPALRRSELPETLMLPADWVVDPWLLLAVCELAAGLGYKQAPGYGRA